MFLRRIINLAIVAAAMAPVAAFAQTGPTNPFTAPTGVDFAAIWSAVFTTNASLILGGLGGVAFLAIALAVFRGLRRSSSRFGKG
jgi:hypothetical protein